MRNQNPFAPPRTTQSSSPGSVAGENGGRWWPLPWLVSVSLLAPGLPLLEMRPRTVRHLLLCASLLLSWVVALTLVSTFSEASNLRRGIAATVYLSACLASVVLGLRWRQPLPRVHIRISVRELLRATFGVLGTRTFVNVALIGCIATAISLTLLAWMAYSFSGQNQLIAPSGEHVFALALGFLLVAFLHLCIAANWITTPSFCLPCKLVATIAWVAVSGVCFLGVVFLIVEFVLPRLQGWLFR